MRINPAPTRALLNGFEYFELYEWVRQNQPTYYREMRREAPFPRSYIREGKEALLEAELLVPGNDWESRDSNEPQYLVTWDFEEEVDLPPTAPRCDLCKSTMAKFPSNKYKARLKCPNCAYITYLR